ncbi:MAG: Holliday junction resolvase RuvX [Lachnospiraceae bacterium]|nr:Holliday junction resolvase RuvX [Lachnospiraceae bacterium]MDO4409561.1 Holliday junction resolvase RuvX [Eubacteriales bacterium]
MRIMGLDFGSKTCGVAISDSLMITAQPKEIIRRDRENKLRKTFARIEKLIEEYDVGLIVLGLPLNMDDTEGERARRTLEFQDSLKRRTGLPVVMSDERLTSVEAEEIMQKQGIPREKYHDYVDMIAANIILSEYMEKMREQEEKQQQ